MKTTAQLSVLFPYPFLGEIATEVRVFTLTADASLDWIKQNADDLALRSTGRSDYIALYVTPDDRYAPPAPGADTIEASTSTGRPT